MYTSIKVEKLERENKNRYIDLNYFSEHIILRYSYKIYEFNGIDLICIYFHPRKKLIKTSTIIERTISIIITILF